MGTLKAATIRLGHSFPHPRDTRAIDPVGDLIELMNDRTPLGPRDPQDNSVVWRAESLLNIERTHRPVYAYIGCLHPALGTIGLILRQDWLAREPQGVSRCDTGGLAGRLGGFGALSNEEAEQAVVSLSLPINDSWSNHLDSEINSAHANGWTGYLQGIPPSPDHMPDARGICIKHVQQHGEDPDRRLWTWEARSFAHIEPTDVEAVALSPEAAKEFYDRIRTTSAPPSALRFIVGRVDPNGVHHFHEDAVLRAFEGETL